MKEEILKTIFENSDVIFDNLIAGANLSEKKYELSKKLWNLLLSITPPETLFHLIYHYYLLKPNDFLNLISEFKDKIKEILK